jgi:hypothetical protein
MMNVGKHERRPACGQCGGTGFVYLWSVARAGPRTWFCDRCKRSWSDGELSLAALFGDQVVAPTVLPVLASGEQEPLEPALNGGGAAEPNQPGPQRLRVVESTGVKVAAAPHGRSPL